MYIVSSAVPLTAVVMAHANEMSDSVLSMPPLKKHIYIFDVTSEASIDDVKAALGKFTIDEGFKVIGERRFFFRVTSNDVAALHSLAFPAGSVVIQHMVEDLDYYLDQFGAGHGFHDNYTIQKSPESILFLIQFRLNLPETECPKAYEIAMRGWARELKSLHFMTNSTIYVDMASYPASSLQILNMEDNMVQNVTQMTVSVQRGYGAFQMLPKRVVRI